jgi:hypothetical protein
MPVLDKHISVLEEISLAAVTFIRVLNLVTLKVRRQKQFTVKQDVHVISSSVLTREECKRWLFLYFNHHLRP